METAIAGAQQASNLLLDRLQENGDLAFGSGRMEGDTAILPVAGIDEDAIRKAFSEEKCVYVSLCFWSARLEMCQWRRETLDKESIWDEARSTSLSRW